MPASFCKHWMHLLHLMFRASVYTLLIFKILIQERVCYRYTPHITATGLFKLLLYFLISSRVKTHWWTSSGPFKTSDKDEASKFIAVLFWITVFFWLLRHHLCNSCKTLQTLKLNVFQHQYITHIPYRTWSTNYTIVKMKITWRFCFFYVQGLAFGEKKSVKLLIVCYKITN